MGRQVRFYMLPEEEHEFLDFACKEPYVKILRDVSSTKDFIIDRTELEKERNFHLVFLWDSRSPFLPEYVHQCKSRSTILEKGVERDIFKTIFRFDTSNPDVIELSRPCFNSKGKLIQARLWADMYRVEGDHFVPKDQRFISWYEQIAAWLRKRLTNNKQLDAYISKNAYDWWKSGGVLY